MIEISANYIYKAIVELGYRDVLVRCGDTIDSIVWENDIQDKPTQEQIETKVKELEAEEIKNQIEKRASNFVKKQLDVLDYDNEGEVALYAANENSEWHDEAVKLQVWIEAVYKKMYELQESITIDNYKTIDLDKIEAEYPAFE